MTKYIATLAFLCLASLASGQSALVNLRDLSDDEYAALERANEASVTATISFLASDELAGRKSETKEFQIATAYVASRLQAAGAQGLGQDGSFYVESEVDTQQAPETGAMAQQGQTNLKVSTLNGADEGLEFSGKLLVVESSTAKIDVPGPVAMRFTERQGARQNGLRQLSQRAASLKSRGATALIALIGKDSPLWATAEQRQAAPRLVTSRGQLALPIMLIASEDFSDAEPIQLVIPANMQKTATMRNVAGVLRGSDDSLATQAILFSAHLDHLGDGGTGEDPIYNGADDDASGVTAVLTLADVFGAMKTKPKRSLIFTTFWGEELGLVGSSYFVASPPWPLENIVANVNIEMIGRPAEGAENKMWMTGWTASNLGDLVAQGSRRVGVESFEHPQYSAQLYRASDNYSFVKEGVVAHSFSAGSLHSDYHQVSDEWQKLNLPHMTQIIRGIYAGSLPIADGLATPQDK